MVFPESQGAPMEAVLDYYMGAYGPTIRFDTNSRNPLLRLKEAFRTLIRGEKSVVELHRLQGLQVTNIAELTAELVELAPRVALERMASRKEGAVFRWRNTKEGWQDCADLVEPLAECSGPGHQYLTVERVDDALVEVCFRERPGQAPLA
jgi:hypothetical protein